MRRAPFFVVALCVGLISAGCIGPRTQLHPNSGTALDTPGPTPTGAEVDLAFLVRMVPHDQIAVATAQIELQKGTRSDVKLLAQSIVDEQKRNITELKRIGQQQPSPTPDTTMDGSGALGTLTSEPSAADDNGMPATVSAASDPDRAFLEHMIPFHAMAIVLADAEARHGSDPRLKAIAQNIVANEARETGEMESMLANPPG